MLDKVSQFFGAQVDNSPLVFFRMCFGFLVAAETIGAIFTGWVERVMILPQFTFTFIGFEWLQPLPGNGMYFYFLVMGIAGLLIMVGLFYRYATILFFVMWTCVYLMQKTEYNNHYYLLILLSGIMAIMPANKSRSLDVKWGFTQESNTCPQVCHWFFIIQILIVYVIASSNKMHTDWVMARPLSIWFQYKSHFWLIGPLLAKEWFQYAIAWGGILYDGLIFFLLLYKPTRKMGFVLSLIFNLFNSAVFHIGIFPYLMISLTVFFYPPDQIRRIFFKKKAPIQPLEGKLSPALTIAVIGYFIIQLALPLRHHLYEGDVHWTEEGHKMAWQMMLRTKSGVVTFEVVDKETGEREKIALRDYVTQKQRRSMAGEPDLIWQFAQRLKEEYKGKGKDISVFVFSRLSLNGHPAQPLIDPDVDLAAVPWDTWKHSDWILTYDSYD